MFSTALQLDCLVACLLLSGCSGSSRSGPPEDPAPEPIVSNSSISAIVLPGEISGDVEVRVTVVDPESDPELEVSLDDGTTWLSGRVLDDTGLVGLPSSPEGIESSFIWNTLADLGFHHDTTALLRISPSDPIGLGTAETVVVPVADNLRLAAAQAGLYQPGSGLTNCYIHPPYSFKGVDTLITNFHLPRSSLLALVYAFGGTELIREAYDYAIKNKFRFYSYGDAMLIL